MSPLAGLLLFMIDLLPTSYDVGYCYIAPTELRTSASSYVELT